MRVCAEEQLKISAHQGDNFHPPEQLDLRTTGADTSIAALDGGGSADGFEPWC